MLPWSLGLEGGRDKGVGVDGRFTCVPQAAPVYLITSPRCSLKQVFQVNAGSGLAVERVTAGFCFFGFFVLPFFDCLVLAWLFSVRGGSCFFSTATLPHCQPCPVDGTAILWDTQRNTSFSGVLQDEGLLFCRLCGAEGIWSGH